MLKGIKRNKSAGTDDLPPGMIKDCASSIASPLSYIINLSLTSGIVPDIWKEAKITPVHKSGLTTKPENFRPISVLPIFSKILERAVHSQIISYLEKNKLLSKSQFGYRKGRSTQLAATLLIDDIRKSVDRRELVGAVFIDLSKAFDTLGHNVMLDKLVKYGIIDIEHEWFSNYLFHCSQVVYIENAKSEKTFMFSGVPQGSLLGPILFLLFFNDFGDCLQKAKVIKYADDTVIYFSHHDFHVIEKTLNGEMKNVSSYFHENELIMNTKKGKTETMLFGTFQRLNANPTLNILYRNERINNTESYTYLGNIIDPTLSLNDNFDKSVKKATTRLKLLHRIRYMLTADATKKVYMSTILPILTYCGTLKLNLTRTKVKRLESIEIRANSLINRENAGLAVPSTMNRIKPESCVIVKKVLENDICENFIDYFKLSNHSYNTRNKGLIIVLPRINLEIARSSFFFTGAKIFNDLPAMIREADMESFKKLIIKHFEG